MSTGAQVDRCFSFISCQLSSASPDGQHALSRPNPAITLSRQTGSGAMAIANELADFLQRRAPARRGAWTVFDKNLVEKVLEEHNLPKEIVKFMPEDRVSAIRDMMEELLGLHPSSWTLLHQTTETILHLAELGNVILVGRASCFITRQMKNVFHVRLIAPLEKRVESVMAWRRLSHADALEFIGKEELGRKRYLADNFKTTLDDNLQYDLVVNTARIPHVEAAHLIGEAVLHWAKTL